MEPPVKGTIPDIAFRSVLFPAPFEPITVTISPVFTVRETSLKAAKCPY
jgi:hypothetical protein